MTVAPASLNERAAGGLDGLRDAGTFKHFNTLSSPQGPVVEMAGRGEVLVLSSNNYLGLAARPEVVAAGIEGFAPVRRGNGFCPLHLRHLRSAPRARARAGRAGRDGGGSHLRLVLERERGGHSEPHRRGDGDPVRRAQPREHRGRSSVGAAGAQGDLRALVDGRAPGGACLLSAGSAQARHHRRRLQHGGRSRAVARDRRACPRARCNRRGRRLARNRRDGRDRTRCRRALRPRRRDRRDHEHARQGAWWCSGRLRGLERRGLRDARPALAAAAVLERDSAHRRLQRPRGGARPAPGSRNWSSGCRRSLVSSEAGCARSASTPSTARRRSSRSSSERRSSRSASARGSSRKGVFVTGFGFPVVPEGTARVRVQMSAAIEQAHVDRALETFERVGSELGVIQAGQKGGS